MINTSNLPLLNDADSMLAILRQAPGNYLILLPDENFTVIEVSDHYHQLTLTRRDQVIGKSIFDVIRSGHKETETANVFNLKTSLQQVIYTGEPHQMPVLNYIVSNPQEAKSNEKYFLPVNKPVLINGKIAYIIYSVEDITESRLLKLSEINFKALADDTPFMVWRCHNQICNYVNKAWCEFTGLDFEDSIGKGFVKAFHPDDLAKEDAKFAATAAVNGIYESKYRLLHKDGSYRWIMAKATPQLFDDKIHYIGSIIDISEQELARHRIEESEKQFRQMADSIIQMIWVTDHEGKHQYYNQQWYDFTGASPDQTQKDDSIRFIHPTDRENALEVWHHSLKTGKSFEVEYRLQNARGEYRWVLDRAAPYYDKEGKIVKWFGTCTDINGQKLLQQQKEEFISVASHELKTPLTSLSASIQLADLLVKKEKVSPTLVRMVEGANIHVRKLSKLVNDLLSVTKIEQGQLILHKTYFNLADLITSCINLIPTNGQEIKVLLNHDDTKILADESKLEQVLINLINNALKYAPDGKEVIITSEINDERVKISVRDYGYGIAAEKLPHLFERYYRADDMGYQYSGLGLGLYICQQIVNKHGGEIGVISEIGKGSDFWFTIPLKLY